MRAATSPARPRSRVGGPATTWRSLDFERGCGLVVETRQPDAFYARLTDMAASGQFGVIDEVTSPDDNLQAVFQYLVK